MDVVVEFTYRDNDGIAWFEDGRIYINLRWVSIEDEIEWYIDEGFIHEYIEHILGLGHRNAVFVERVLRKLLYTEWYQMPPTKMLYGKHCKD